MKLHKSLIPVGALTLALSVGGSVAQAAERDGHKGGGHQNQGQARERAADQRGHAQRGNEQRAQQENNARVQQNNNTRVQRDNNARVQRDNNFRSQSNAQVERRAEGWNRGNDRAVRGYAVQRPRVEVVRPRVQVVRPRFNHHYGPSFSVFFGVGSGYRYGVPYSGRVYGYVPGPIYGAPVYYGDVRLQMRPRDAQVFVDGYYAGIVDNFDGVFQRLTLTVGPHEIEIEAPGFEPQVYNVMVDPSRTVDLRGDLYPAVP
jgi:PEGA domain-containing protein